MLPATNKVAAAQLQRDQGAARAVLRPVRPPVDRRERRPLLQLRLHRRARRPRRRAASPSPAGGGEFAVYGLSIYDVEPKTWELRERTFVSRALELRRAQLRPRARLAAHHRRAVRRTSRSSTAARAGDRPRPGGEIEPPSYFQREEKPSDTMGFWRAARLHRLARVARLRRGEAAGPAAAQGRVPDGRARDDAAGGAVLVRRGAPRRALRHRHRDRDGDRLLGRAQQLRGARQQRATSTRRSRRGRRTCSSARPGST